MFPPNGSWAAEPRRLGVGELLLILALLALAIVPLIAEWRAPRCMQGCASSAAEADDAPRSGDSW